MRKKIFIIMSICICVIGCLVLLYMKNHETMDTREILAYVPLDNRPDESDRVIYFAESLDYKIKIPDSDLYSTRLDYQPTNSNGTQSGDRGAIYEWILEQEKEGCNKYIIFVDQLLSGGLVNSRYMSKNENIILSDGETITEFEALENILLELGKDSNNKVWLLETNVRLASTVGYKGYEVNEYEATRLYGMEPRKILVDDELTFENVIKNYRLTNGKDAEYYGLTKEQEEKYLSVRKRKLELSKYMFELLNKYELDNFKVLIGIDDSSKTTNIQTNEIAYLKSLLRDGDNLLTGVDDMVYKAIAKLYLDEHKDIERPTIAISYYGDASNDIVSDYNYQPLSTIIDELAAFFETKIVEDAKSADIHMLVLTPPDDDEKKEKYVSDLIEQINKNEENNKLTIFVNADNNKYGETYYYKILSETNLGYLLNYSGFINMANVTGNAMSHGIARYMYLKNGEITPQAQNAFAKTLVDILVKDFCYGLTVRSKIAYYVSNDLSGNSNNFYFPKIDQSKVQDFLLNGVKKTEDAILNNIENSKFIYSLNPYEEKKWSNISISNYRFPWYRTFEIGIDIEIDDFV